MIFSGDFPQLPPINGGESSSLYSGSIGTQIYSGLTHYGQESAIGKALWHQVTTVVILRENMRQTLQTVEDTKFRKALENMRYKACTQEDIAFLHTRTTGPGTDKPNWLKKTFRMYLSSQHGTHKKTESMNLAPLNLQKKLTSIL